MSDAPAPRPRRDLLATLAILGALGVAVAAPSIARRFARHPTPERCASMLERYAEQEARARSRVPSSARVPVDAPAVARCARELTDDEVECALKSGYSDELERCLP